MRLIVGSLIAMGSLGLLGACGAHSGAGARSVRGGATPELCEQNKQKLVALLNALPAVTVASTTRSDLPTSSIGRTPGTGPVVEIAANEVVLDGVPVNAAAPADRVARFREWVTAWAPDGKAPAPLYVAAAASVDVQTLRAYLVVVPDSVELRLLVRVPKGPSAASSGDETNEARELAVKVLTEPSSPDLGRTLASEYTELSRCQAVTQAVSSASLLGSKERWPALKSGLVSALPTCDCNGLDSASLRLLVSAEQRAGAASLGWVPLGYVKDERCGASMPLRSVDKLVHQLEAFEDEFSAQFQNDAVTFQNVIETERLRVTFCDALPGETIAALANAKSTLYFPAGGSCEAWSFSPLSVGSPMGTLRRQGAAPLAFHYWQASEEFRVFGPIDAAVPSKPTDEKDWACEETLHLTAIDQRRVQLGELTWYYDAATCSKAAVTERGLSGCAAARASGSTPAP